MENVSLEWVETQLCLNRFRSFVEIFWPAVSNDHFVSGYHIDAVCEHLQAVADNKISRLCINLAIRHSKSLLCSVFFPVWCWLRRPETRIITASYSKTLTTRDAIRSRQLIDNPKFQSYFGGLFRLAEDQNRQDAYSNDKKGHRLSVSIDSRTAGFDADLVIADDLHDFASRTSETERNRAIDYFETSLQSRLVRSGREAVVLAGHRIHEDDVYTRLRTKYGDDGSWTWLVLPEEYSPKFSTFFNGIGWKDRRREGELLWPERFHETAIKEEKKRYGHEYSTIFLQEPTPADGTLFKTEWFQTYSTETDQDGTEVYTLGKKKYNQAKAWRFATVDTAISTNPGSDWTVCQVWDSISGNLVLVDQLRKKLDGTKIVPELTEFYRYHKPQFLSVETEFVGRFVIDQLRQKNVLVKPFSARGHGSKETRAVAAEIRLAQGQVWFPSQPWVADLKTELLAFPNGAHDDQTDCLSMACLLAERYQGATEPELTPEEKEEKQQRDKRDSFERLLWAGAEYEAIR